MTRLSEIEEQVCETHIPPVEVSAEAMRGISIKVREWSGWPNAVVVNDFPTVSPYAECDHATRTITACFDRLVRNPNRVLLAVTPFRLRQEAVLTGALLHESGHARFSHWLPRTEADLGPEGKWAGGLVHGHNSPHYGEPVTKQTLALARLMEEARVEGQMAKIAPMNGAGGLEWTMNATMAALTPLTQLSSDPAQQTMDVITSWALRAAKRRAIDNALDAAYPTCVTSFDNLLRDVLVTHLTMLALPPLNASREAYRVINMLSMMAASSDHTGTTMLDSARDVLDILFPETAGDEDGQPMPGEGCTGHAVGVGAGEADGEGAGQGEAGSEGEQTEQSELAKALAEALAGMEQQTAEDSKEQAKEQTTAEAIERGGKSAGMGAGNRDADEWRMPTAAERQVQKGAERFLRSMIEPSESTKVSLSDQPSSQVDPAALAAWKAGGQQREPHFFRRTQRSVEPSPPVKIAILCDVSGSMDELQKPTALLSWALSAAALDLRNFAGRGQQIESCLIHWGTKARVIQGVGQPLPGLREYECNEGTSALADACELVEDQMPGFFDPPERPVSRLMVNFTDWYLGLACIRESTPWIQRMLESGAHMLSVVPKYSRISDSSLPTVTKDVSGPGRAELLYYNKQNPQEVWDAAAATLSGIEYKPAPFSGF